MKSLGRILCLAAMGLGLAQAAQNVSPEEKRAAYPALIGIKLADPSLTSPVSPPGFNLQLTTEQKNKRAKAKIGLQLGDDFFLEAIFSAPLGDSESEAEPIDLDGLARSAALDVGFHYLLWKPRLEAGRAEDIRTEYVRRHPGETDFVLTLNNLKGEPDLLREFLGAITWNKAVFAGLRAKVGRQGFTYADSHFKESSEQKTNIALEAAAGVLFPQAGYIGFSFEAQRFFEAGTSVDLIFPFQGGPVQQIKKYVLSPPRQRNRARFELEYRKTIGPFGAVNPRVSYFPRENIVLLELPVYAFRSPEQGLNGGVNFAWSSKEGGLFGVALFIGSAFSLTPSRTRYP